MIEFGLFGILAFIVLVVIQFIMLKNGAIKRKDIFACLAFNVYVFFLIKLTLFPIPIQKMAIEMFTEINGDISYNFIPLSTILYICRNNDTQNIVYQLGGNLMLLLPFGIYLTVIFSKLKINKGIMILIISSVTIEMTQLLIGTCIGCYYRIVDIDDIILNVIGGIVGLLLGKIVSPIYDSLCERIGFKK